MYRPGRVFSALESFQIQNHSRVAQALLGEVFLSQKLVFIIYL
jgi:hypothetical protein